MRAPPPLADLGVECRIIYIIKPFTVIHYNTHAHALKINSIKKIVGKGNRLIKKKK